MKRHKSMLQTVYDSQTYVDKLSSAHEAITPLATVGNMPESRVPCLTNSKNGKSIDTPCQGDEQIHLESLQGGETNRIPLSNSPIDEGYGVSKGTETDWPTNGHMTFRETTLSTTKLSNESFNVNRESDKTGSTYGQETKYSMLPQFKADTTPHSRHNSIDGNSLLSSGVAVSEPSLNHVISTNNDSTTSVHAYNGTDDAYEGTRPVKSGSEKNVVQETKLFWIPGTPIPYFETVSSSCLQSLDSDSVKSFDSDSTNLEDCCNDYIEYSNSAYVNGQLPRDTDVNGDTSELSEVVLKELDDVLDKEQNDDDKSGSDSVISSNTGDINDTSWISYQDVVNNHNIHRSPPSSVTSSDETVIEVETSNIDRNQRRLSDQHDRVIELSDSETVIETETTYDDVAAYSPRDLSDDKLRRRHSSNCVVSAVKSEDISDDETVVESETIITAQRRVASPEKAKYFEEGIYQDDSSDDNTIIETETTYDKVNLTTNREQDQLARSSKRNSLDKHTKNENIETSDLVNIEPVEKWIDTTHAQVHSQLDKKQDGGNSQNVDDDSVYDEETISIHETYDTTIYYTPDQKLTNDLSWNLKNTEISASDKIDVTREWLDSLYEDQGNLLYRADESFTNDIGDNCEKNEVTSVLDDFWSDRNKLVEYSNYYTEIGDSRQPSMPAILNSVDEKEEIKYIRGRPLNSEEASVWESTCSDTSSITEISGLSSRQGSIYALDCDLSEGWEKRRASYQATRTTGIYTVNDLNDTLTTSESEDNGVEVTAITKQNSQRSFPVKTSSITSRYKGDGCTVDVKSVAKSLEKRLDFSNFIKANSHPVQKEVSVFNTTIGDVTSKSVTLSEYDVSKESSIPTSTEVEYTTRADKSSYVPTIDKRNDEAKKILNSVISEMHSSKFNAALKRTGMGEEETTVQNFMNETTESPQEDYDARDNLVAENILDINSESILREGDTAYSSDETVREDKIVEIVKKVPVESIDSDAEQIAHRATDTSPVLSNTSPETTVNDVTPPARVRDKQNISESRDTVVVDGVSFSPPREKEIEQKLGNKSTFPRSLREQLVYVGENKEQEDETVKGLLDHQGSVIIVNKDDPALEVYDNDIKGTNKASTETRRDISDRNGNDAAFTEMKARNNILETSTIPDHVIHIESEQLYKNDRTFHKGLRNDSDNSREIKQGAKECRENSQNSRNITINHVNIDQHAIKDVSEIKRTIDSEARVDKLDGRQGMLGESAPQTKAKPYAYFSDMNSSPVGTTPQQTLLQLNNTQPNVTNYTFQHLPEASAQPARQLHSAPKYHVDVDHVTIRQPSDSAGKLSPVSLKSIENTTDESLTDDANSLNSSFTTSITDCDTRSSFRKRLKDLPDVDIKVKKTPIVTTESHSVRYHPNSLVLSSREPEQPQTALNRSLDSVTSTSSPRHEHRLYETSSRLISNSKTNHPVQGRYISRIRTHSLNDIPANTAANSIQIPFEKSGVGVSTQKNNRGSSINENPVKHVSTILICGKQTARHSLAENIKDITRNENILEKNNALKLTKKHSSSETGMATVGHNGVAVIRVGGSYPQGLSAQHRSNDNKYKAELPWGHDISRASSASSLNAESVIKSLDDTLNNESSNGTVFRDYEKHKYFEKRHVRDGKLVSGERYREDHSTKNGKPIQPHSPTSPTIKEMVKQLEIESAQPHRGKIPGVDSHAWSYHTASRERGQDARGGSSKTQLVVRSDVHASDAKGKQQKKEIVRETMERKTVESITVKKGKESGVPAKNISSNRIAKNNVVSKVKIENNPTTNKGVYSSNTLKKEMNTLQVPVVSPVHALKSNTLPRASAGADISSDVRFIKENKSSSKILFTAPGASTTTPVKSEKVRGEVEKLGHTQFLVRDSAPHAKDKRATIDQGDGFELRPRSDSVTSVDSMSTVKWMEEGNSGRPTQNGGLTVTTNEVVHKGPGKDFMKSKQVTKNVEKMQESRFVKKKSDVRNNYRVDQTNTIVSHGLARSNSSASSNTSQETVKNKPIEPKPLNKKTQIKEETRVVNATKADRNLTNENIKMSANASGVLHAKVNKNDAINNVHIEGGNIKSFPKTGSQTTTNVHGNIHNPTQRNNDGTGKHFANRDKETKLGHEIRAPADTRKQRADSSVISNSVDSTAQSWSNSQQSQASTMPKTAEKNVARVPYDFSSPDHKPLANIVHLEGASSLQRSDPQNFHRTEINRNVNNSNIRDIPVQQNHVTPPNFSSSDTERVRSHPLRTSTLDRREENAKTSREYKDKKSLEKHKNISKTVYDGQRRSGKQYLSTDERHITTVSFDDSDSSDGSSSAQSRDDKKHRPKQTTRNSSEKRPNYPANNKPAKRNEKLHDSASPGVKLSSPTNMVLKEAISTSYSDPVNRGQRDRSSGRKSLDISRSSLFSDEELHLRKVPSIPLTKDPVAMTIPGLQDANLSRSSDFHRSASLDSLRDPGSFELRPTRSASLRPDDVVFVSRSPQPTAAEPQKRSGSPYVSTITIMNRRLNVKDPNGDSGTGTEVGSSDDDRKKDKYQSPLRPVKEDMRPTTSGQKHRPSERQPSDDAPAKSKKHRDHESHTTINRHYIDETDYYIRRRKIHDSRDSSDDKASKRHHRKPDKNNGYRDDSPDRRSYETLQKRSTTESVKRRPNRESRDSSKDDLRGKDSTRMHRHSKKSPTRRRDVVDRQKSPSDKVSSSRSRSRSTVSDSASSDNDVARHAGSTKPRESRRRQHIHREEVVENVIHKGSKPTQQDFSNLRDGRERRRSKSSRESSRDTSTARDSSGSPRRRERPKQTKSKVHPGRNSPNYVSTGSEGSRGDITSTRFKTRQIRAQGRSSDDGKERVSRRRKQPETYSRRSNMYPGNEELHLVNETLETSRRVRQRDVPVEYEQKLEAAGEPMRYSTPNRETDVNSNRIPKESYEYKHFQQIPTSSEHDGDDALKVVTGKILIKNSMDISLDDDEDLDNLNIFDDSFSLNKDNPLYHSDQDLSKTYEDRKKREERSTKQSGRRKHVAQVWCDDDVDGDDDIPDCLHLTFQSNTLDVPKAGTADTEGGIGQIINETKRTAVDSAPNRKKQNLSSLLLSKLSQIDPKDVSQNIDVEHKHEEIFGDIDFVHADGSKSSARDTTNFDTVSEHIDLILREGKAVIVIKVIAERIIPVDPEFNVWRKSQAIVTRNIEIDLKANEQRRRLYDHVMRNTSRKLQANRGKWGDEGTLNSRDTLKLFSRLLTVADKDRESVQTDDIKYESHHKNVDEQAGFLY